MAKIQLGTVASLAILFACLALSSEALSTNASMETLNATSFTNGGVLQPTDTVYNCTAQGFFCASCDSLVYCEPTSPVSFQSHITMHCNDTGATCTEAGGEAACTDTPDLACDARATTYTFRCRQRGVFPDPFTCRKYHMCTEERPYPVNGTAPITVSCPGGYSFDPATLRCTIKRISTCAHVIAPCDGQRASSFVSNPAYYYICRQDVVGGYYYPQVFACTGDRLFIDGKCVDPVKYQGGLGENGTCSNAGNGYRPDCEEYNICVKAGDKPTVKKCTAGMQFDFIKGECVKTKCRGLF